jgi:polyribonucleotide nucleotidyltransferase
MKIITESLELAGRTLTLEVGRLAAQATSAVLARYGDSVVLATVVVGNEDTKKDYFPLSIDYQERLYAGGRIKGSRWVKREGRPTDAEVLSGRLIDRSVRPFRREVQVVVTVLAADTVNDPDILGVIATSAALSISPIPWNGPVSAVRVGLVDGQLVVNPPNGNRSGTELDLVVTGSSGLIDMIEAGANQISEEKIMEALELGFSANQSVISTVTALSKKVGKEKLAFSKPKISTDIVSEIEKSIKPQVEEFIKNSAVKEGVKLDDIVAVVAEKLSETEKAFAPQLVEDLVYRLIRNDIMEKKSRPDGRKLDEIRPLDVQVGVLPRVHGSAIFQRGQTQVLTVTTLGAPSLSQSLESAEGEETKRYMHHYNFPPYSTGETGRMSSPGRREIGHGALAERALSPVIPPEQQFPYAIRLVSEVMSSNGSTSMASTCGSTLSLMDAGVPLLAPVAGISIGLITSPDYPKKTDKFVFITDIVGMEDHYGDMDFKVAGTEKGITAIQLDVKVPGLTLEICRETLTRARIARIQILQTMLKVLPTSREQLSPFAPKISTVQIPVDRIGELIGPGGKVIRKLMADTETVIDVQDDGSVFITGLDTAKVQDAVSWISSLGKEVSAGEIYEGVVARIQPFGAFVNILPGKDGLVHVSQMAQGFVSDPNTIVHEGQAVRVWVTEIDSQGRINLSMLFDADGNPVIKAREERPPRNNQGYFQNSRPQERDRRSRRF